MNLEGRQFGHLTVLRKGEPYPSGPARWWCRCGLCGEEKLIGQGALITKGNVSCGCKRRIRLLEKICSRCGEPLVRKKAPPSMFYCPNCFNRRRREKYHLDQRKYLWSAAQSRAKQAQIPFNLTIEDIVIPDVCPVLGIKLEVGSRQKHNSSPSLDRLNPELGYVAGNIQVISWRANRIKCDGTLEELEKIVTYMRKNGL